MQRYSSSQGYTQYADNRSQPGMHVFQASPPTGPPQQIVPPSPSIGGMGGAPIALASHPSTPAVGGQPFDTFDDIEWPWTPPTSMEHQQRQQQHSQSPHQHQQHQQQAPHGQHGQYAYGFSSPPSSHPSFGPGSPHSPHQHAPVYAGSDGAGPYGPLSAQSSAVGSYSTSPPAMSPLSSMPPPHEQGHNNYGAPRSQQSQYQHHPSQHDQQSLHLSSSLPVTSVDYRMSNGAGQSHFTFPSSPSPSNQQSHQPFSAASPVSAGAEWASSLSSAVASNEPSQTGGRPIRRRPNRKSESDTSYTSPAALAARLHLQRSMSGGGAQELNVNAPNNANGNFIFMPPSSPLSSTPPPLPIFLPSASTGPNGTSHKHSRSRSSGGSSSPGGGSGLGGLLLSTSPTSPSDMARAARGMATSALTATRDLHEQKNNGVGETIPEDQDAMYLQSPSSDGEEDASSKKRRKRESRDEKDFANMKDSKPQETPRKSLLQPPKASPSTWQIYFTDQLQLYRSRHPDQKLNVAQAAKELAQEYKRLSNEEREPYKRRAQAAKADRDRQMAAWSRTLTPGDVRAENAFRAAQRKDGKSRKANMKDPNAPKKPLSAYFMFLQRIRASKEMVREVFGDEVGTTRQSVLAAAKWRSMSDEEKKPFLARAEQEKLIYEERRRQYEEMFADPDDNDSGYGRSIGSDGLTLSGHFVGIEQLSLNETFTSGPLPNIKAFQVNTFGSENNNRTGSPTKMEVTDDDVREAFEHTMLQRIPN